VRKIADCRAMPSESQCSLTITGDEEEVVRAAAEHAVSAHGHADTPEFREQVRASLTDERDQYGTIMVGKRRADLGEMRAAGDQWARERRVPGFLREDLLAADDGETIIAAVRFASRADYQRLAEDPAQAEWWSTVLAPMLDGEPTWIDGAWLEPIERVAPAAPPVGMPAQGGPAASEAQHASRP